jgi:hypothetical protein
MNIIKAVLEESRLRENTGETVSTVFTALAQKFIDKNNEFDITLINGVSIPMEGGHQVIWDVKDHPNENVYLMPNGEMFVYEKSKHRKVAIK